MDPETSLVILLTFGFFVGGTLAIACYVSLTRRLRIAERDLRRLEQSHAEALRQARLKSRADAMETPAVPIAEPPQTSRPQTPPPRIERPVETSPPPPAPSPQPRPVAPAPVTAAKEALSSLEVTIGAKWLNWVGVVLVIAGAMFFLKYAYDNDWIGPGCRSSDSR
jgi:uncharacterized membrane protein